MRPEEGGGGELQSPTRAQALTSPRGDARDLGRARAPRVSKERPPRSLASGTEFGDVHYRWRDQLCRSRWRGKAARCAPRRYN